MQPHESESAPATPAAATRGSPAFGQAASREPPAAFPAADEALATLRESRARWIRVPLAERAAILDEVLVDLSVVAPRWVDVSLRAKRIVPGTPREGEEWGALASLVRLCRLMRDALRQAAAAGRPALRGPIRQRPDGGLRVQVFPHDIYDRMFFAGYTGELWLEPAVTRDQLEREHRAAFAPAAAGRIALVLGAGNYANLGPADILHKLFHDQQVVVYKSNPVLAYLDPVLTAAFRALISRGLLRLVAGGSAEGAYLAEHPDVAELHLTGSDKTYDAIVFGTGAEGQRRKRERRPRNPRRFTCELGNVSPLIVVPGPWSAADLAAQGTHIASTLTLNAGFNCLSTRVIVQQRGWEHRAALLDAIRRTLGEVPPRAAYYPRAREVHAGFVAAHPEAELIGTPGDDALPWTLIADVDPAHTDDVCFTSEAFCSLFAETAIEARDPVEFLRRAVDLANDTLWGSLTATILVHPRSLQEPRVAAALERALADLRYGTVGVNVWGLVGFLFGTTAWGAFPGHPSHDIQSGNGFVNNALRVPRVQKSVLRAPFRQFPKNAIFVTHRTMHRLFRHMVDFEADPAPSKVPRLAWEALRG